MISSRPGVRRGTITVVTDMPDREEIRILAYAHVWVK